jgi:hypothetical protein
LSPIPLNYSRCPAKRNPLLPLRNNTFPAFPKPHFPDFRDIASSGFSENSLSRLPRIVFLGTLSPTFAQPRFPSPAGQPFPVSRSVIRNTVSKQAQKKLHEPPSAVPVGVADDDNGTIYGKAYVPLFGTLFY